MVQVCFGLYLLCCTCRLHCY